VSATALKKTEPNFITLMLAMAAPLMLGFVILMVLVFNDGFLSQDINTKSLTMIVLCLSSVAVMLIGTTIWAIVYRRLRAAGIVWGVVAVGAVAVWLLLQLQHIIVMNM